MANLTKIQPRLQTLPKCPGVYQFIAGDGQVIYVGKSVCLRNRVRSYFVPSQKWGKVASMLPFIDDIVIFPQDTHLEARLLECELIKTLSPLFNRQMKSDGRYVYLDLPPDALPRIRPERGTHSLGPFRGSHNLKFFLQSLERLYPLELTASRVSFSYHPLPRRLNAFELRDTAQTLDRCFADAAILSSFITSVEEAMAQAAADLHFEQAVFYRDLLPTLRLLHKHVSKLKDFLAAEFHVNIPLAKGQRHFYIRNGLVVDTVFTDDENFNVDLFIFTARALPDRGLDDKAALDYRDIVFTELEGLPEGQVERLG